MGVKKRTDWYSERRRGSRIGREREGDSMLWGLTNDEEKGEKKGGT